mmetsp:Transcript_37114/g.124334  ORF Transcript_37114/g.124334 Transcript_37114/m.124334 type:complete len:289 (-) Transcript_37114:828-1694(-)
MAGTTDSTTATSPPDAAVGDAPEKTRKAGVIAATATETAAPHALTGTGATGALTRATGGTRMSGGPLATSVARRALALRAASGPRIRRPHLIKARSQRRLRAQTEQSQAPSRRQSRGRTRRWVTGWGRSGCSRTPPSQPFRRLSRQGHPSQTAAPAAEAQRRRPDPPKALPRRTPRKEPATFRFWCPRTSRTRARTLQCSATATTRTRTPTTSQAAAARRRERKTASKRDQPLTSCYGAKRPSPAWRRGEPASRCSSSSNGAWRACACSRPRLAPQPRSSSKTRSIST